MNKDQNLWVDLNLFNQPSRMGQIWEGLVKIRWDAHTQVQYVYIQYVYIIYVYVCMYYICIYTYTVSTVYMYMSMPYPNLCCPPLTQKRVTKNCKDLI